MRNLESDESLYLRGPLKLIAFAAWMVLHPFFQNGLCDSKKAAVPLRIVFIGDSITEGFGLPQEQAYPALVETELKKTLGKKLTIVNAGISGSTSSSALSRLKWELRANPDLLVLALGANDGLRGTAISETKKNLESTIVLAKSKGVKVLLAGMKMPPNYGEKYSLEFEQIFIDIAKAHQITFMPFLLEGVAGDKNLNQADAIHPNAKGQQIIATRILPYIHQALR